MKPWYKFYDKHEISRSPEFKDITLIQMFTERVKRHPSRPMIAFEGKLFSYQTIYNESRKFASWLISQGIAPGDKIAVALPNIPQTIIALYGIWMAGATYVGLNPLYTKRELEFQIENSDAKIVVMLDLFANKLVNVDIPIIVTSIITYFPLWKRFLAYLFARKSYKKSLAVKYIDWNTTLTGDMLSEPLFRDNIDQIASMLFTGGTTGIQKAVMRSHRTISHTLQSQNIWYADALAKISPDKNVCFTTFVPPIFHIYGLEHGHLYMMFNGVCNVLMPLPSAKTIIKISEKYNIVVLHAVPAILERIVKIQTQRKHKCRINNKILVFSAAGKLSESLLEDFKKAFGVYIIDAYGMTEAAPIAQGFWNLDTRPTKPNATGIPSPGLDIKIVDLEDREKELPLGEYGEICVKGVQVMEGYYNMNNDHENPLKDGWLLTGDCGYMDEDGWLYIAGRKKEMVSVNGFKVYAQEIEDLLNAHPKVKEGCMIGKELPFGSCGAWTGEIKNNEIVKVVVVKKDESLTEQELIAYFKEVVAPYKVPKEVQFIDKLPRDVMGKVRKKDLKQL